MSRLSHLDILTCAEVRAAEERHVALGGTMWGLMLKAGEACADILHARQPVRREDIPIGRVVVLAGPGNNGGDAFVAARRLVDLGREVLVFELAAGARTAEAARARAECPVTIRSISELFVQPGDIVLDGLFGSGLNRDLEGAARDVARDIHAAEAVVAIDLPSGLRGDSGAYHPCLRADVTVTFGARKPVHVLQPAASSCGEVVVAEIGFGRHVEDVRLGSTHVNDPLLWARALAWPEATTHKHARGRLHVVSGGLASTGAARLAAQAGLRAGAGAVTLLCPPSALMVAASSVTAVMTAGFDGPDALLQATERGSAVVIGPAAGVTPATRANVEALARAGRRLVLDADALSVFAGEAEALREALLAKAVEERAALQAWQASPDYAPDKDDPPQTWSPSVITPHAGEFERLFPGLLAASVNRIEAAGEAAQRAGCVVVLKGADTVVAHGGRAVVNTHATPFLATAGSGDVLAGIIGGLMAQGMEAFDAACAAVWMHGDAGLRAGPGMTAEDLDGALRQTIAALYAAR